MIDPKLFFGTLTIVIGCVSYSFYFRDMMRGTTKPDAFSWLIWGVLAAITFFAESVSGAGAGAWVIAFTASVCLAIAGYAFYRGEHRMKKVDAGSLVGAALGVGFWRYTNDPLLAVISVIVIGMLGFVPTFIKAFSRPLEETPTTFALNASKFAISIFAIGSLSPVTWLYPVAMSIANASLASLIFIRRHGMARRLEGQYNYE